MAGFGEHRVVDRDDLLKGVGLLPDHIGDHRSALHVDAGCAAADNVYSFDLVDGNSRQNVGDGVGLDGRTLAIDEDVARRPGKPPDLISHVERKSRQAADHVERGIRAR